MKFFLTIGIQIIFNNHSFAGEMFGNEIGIGTNLEDQPAVNGLSRFAGPPTAPAIPVLQGNIRVGSSSGTVSTIQDAIWSPLPMAINPVYGGRVPTDADRRQASVLEVEVELTSIRNSSGNIVTSITNTWLRDPQSDANWQARRPYVSVATSSTPIGTPVVGSSGRLVRYRRIEPPCRPGTTPTQVMCFRAPCPPFCL